MSPRQIDALVSERVAEELEVRDVLAARAAEVKDLCRHYSKHLDDNEIAEIVTLPDDEYERTKERVVKFYAKGGPSARPPGSGAPNPAEAAACLAWCGQKGLMYSRDNLEAYRRAHPAG